MQREGRNRIEHANMLVDERPEGTLLDCSTPAQARISLLRAVPTVTAYPVLVESGTNMLHRQAMEMQTMQRQLIELIREQATNRCYLHPPIEPPPGYATPEQKEEKSLDDIPATPAPALPSRRLFMGESGMRVGRTAWSPAATRFAFNRTREAPSFPAPACLVAINGPVVQGKKYHHPRCSTLYCSHGDLRGIAYHAGVRICTLQQVISKEYTKCAYCRHLLPGGLRGG
jgi:hypothetical protein